MLQKTAILDFYDDVVDRLVGWGLVLEEIIRANYGTMRNDSYYCIHRYYTTNVKEIKRKDGKWTYYNCRATMEWEQFLEMLWDLHDLHEYDKVFVWVSW